MCLNALDTTLLGNQGAELTAASCLQPVSDKLQQMWYELGELAWILSVRKAQRYTTGIDIFTMSSTRELATSPLYNTQQPQQACLGYTGCLQLLCGTGINVARYMTSICCCRGLAAYDTTCSALQLTAVLAVPSAARCKHT